MFDLKNPGAQRLAMEAFFFGYQAFTAKADEMLERRGLSRVHQRIVFFIACYPGLSVKSTAGSARRNEAGFEYSAKAVDGMRLVSSATSETDKRMRLLTLTEDGAHLEQALRREQVNLLERVFTDVGAAAVEGWLAVNMALDTAYAAHE